ncbi:M48 family metalloprotease (plasmid) [Peteryoungia desertarenae]|uniref:M48 family metalloprotease n=1 Tax=Peteryoungia desertarenae TaxID=1813451 RepID=A0ABX6QTS2_9HYPH|nr:M48 family metalloprotease [Peteryoungia desertarenae]QLF72056.1 M48 family metalloprotease [Peteryoungia desertarenae]
MVSLSDFFYPLTVQTALLRYGLVSLMRWAVGLLIWQQGSILSYLHPFNASQLTIQLSYILELYIPFGLLLMMVLWLAQVILLYRIIRLVGSDPEEIKAGYRKGGTWLSTPLLLSLVVILTCCTIGWLVQTGGNPGYFLDYVLQFSSLPVQIGLVLSLLGFAFGGRFVAGEKASMGGLFGIRYLPSDHPLSQRVARHAETLGLPSAPAVGIVNVMNAFAIGTPKDSTIVLGQPLMDIITDEELDAVIGHELGHVYHNDMNRMQFAEGFQRMLGSVISATTVVLVSALSRDRSDAMLGRAVGLGLRQTVFCGSELVVKGISRAREYQADAVGARIASPGAMISALQRLHGLPTQPTKLEAQYGYLMFRGSRIGAWFSTHPPVEKRIAALQALKAEPAKVETDSETVIHPKVDALAGEAVNKLGTALGSARTGISGARASFLNAEKGKALWASTSGLIPKLPESRPKGRTIAFAGAGILVVVLAAPAIYDYYELDAKADALSTSFANTTSAVSESIGESIGNFSDWAKASVSGFGENMALIESQQAQIDALNRSLASARAELQQERASQQAAREQISRLTTANMQLSERQPVSAVNESTLATLKAEITRQENLVVSLRRQLAQAKSTPSPPLVSNTATDMQSLRDRNAELSATVENQKSVIYAMTASIQELETKIRQPEVAVSGASAANSVSATTEKWWLAAATDAQGTVYLRSRLGDAEGAKSRALAACRSLGSGCVVQAAYSDVCYAVSRPIGQSVHHNWWEGVASSQVVAEREARAKCEANSGAPQCRITVVECAPASLKRS